MSEPTRDLRGIEILPLIDTRGQKIVPFLEPCPECGNGPYVRYCQFCGGTGHAARSDPSRETDAPGMRDGESVADQTNEATE